MKIISARKTGRCCTGVERDGGVKIHAVAFPDSAIVEHGIWDRAMCGTKPGGKGNGWSFDESSKQITCERCIKEIRKEPLLKGKL